MIIYKCEKCGLFLASFKDKNSFTIKAKKGIRAEGDKIILKCRCGQVTEIDKKIFDK